MTDAVPQIDVARLGQLAELTKGGQGTVYDAPNRKINSSWPVVYKAFSSETLAKLNTAVLTEMIAYLPRLPRDVGEWLCDQAAWPAALVTRNGVVIGFMMRKVPFEFEVRLKLGNNYRTRPAGLEFLLNPDEYTRRIELPIDDRGRLKLLHAIVSNLVRFHAVGIVVGDLSPKNLFFSINEKARCFFVDCDAMRLHGRSVHPQVETPGWEVPTSGEELATTATDAYKLGLLAIRLLGRDQDLCDPRALGFAPALQLLAAKSLSRSPVDRPAPAFWLEPLQAAIDATGGRAGSPLLPITTSIPRTTRKSTRPRMPAQPSAVGRVSYPSRPRFPAAQSGHSASTMPTPPKRPGMSGPTAASSRSYCQSGRATAPASSGQAGTRDPIGDGLVVGYVVLGALVAISIIVCIVWLIVG